MPACNINGQTVTFREGDTILEAARNAGISIPTLCYLKDLNRPAACRMCVVEVEGLPRLVPACATPAKEGMVVRTESEKAVDSRKRTLDLLCRNHRMDCEYCPNYTFCELHALLRRYGIDDRPYSQVYHPRNADESGERIVRDPSKCVLCRRCVAACQRQGLDIIGPLNRAAGTKIGVVVSIADSACTGCGQCVRSCPTGALFVKDDTDLLWRARNNKKKIVLGVMPETAHNIGRFFGAREDCDDFGRLAAVCKKVGACEVFDLTGLRETVLAELDGPGTCCPAHMLRDIAHTKEPETIFHEKVLEYFPDVPREELFIVYISGCTAAKRSHRCDAVLTTTELFQWIQRACVSKFTALDVWKKAADMEPVQLFHEAAPQGGFEPRWACPGGCENGGGQFRIQGSIGGANHGDDC